MCLTIKSTICRCISSKHEGLPVNFLCLVEGISWVQLYSSIDQNSKVVSHSCGLGCSKGERCIGITMAARDERRWEISTTFSLLKPWRLGQSWILALKNPGSKIPPPSFVLYMVMELMEFWSPKECLSENSSHCVIVIDLQHDFITAWVNISHPRCGLQCSLLKVRVDHASNTAAIQPRLWRCQDREISQVEKSFET